MRVQGYVRVCKDEHVADRRPGAWITRESEAARRNLKAGHTYSIPAGEIAGAGRRNVVYDDPSPGRRADAGTA